MQHKRLLRELAKFASGLVAADFLCGAWLHAANLPPITFLWTVWTPSAIAWWMVFDVLLFIVLIHYGWHEEIKEPHIGHKIYFGLVGVITGAVALVHLSRVIWGYGAEVGAIDVPMWFSWIGIVLAGFISYASFRFAARSRD